MRDVVVGAIARTIFVYGWANREAGLGRRHVGDLMAWAPTGVPEDARMAAEMVVRGIEARSGQSIEQILRMAAWADRAPQMAERRDYAERFGNMVALRALGWADEIPLSARVSVPDVEYEYAPGEEESAVGVAFRR